MWRNPFFYFTHIFPGSDVKYGHTLPSENSQLLIGKPDYEDGEFDIVSHATTFDSLEQILDTGNLEPHFVKDLSVCKRNVELFDINDKRVPCSPHPLSEQKILWYGPAIKKQASDTSINGAFIERHGNVMFTKNAEVFFNRDKETPCNFYFVEVVHYRTKSATRILVTDKCYPTLRKYDPEQYGGPWYYDKEKKQNYRLWKIQHSNGNLVWNDLEFIREYGDDELKYGHRAVHELFVKSCWQPKDGIIAFTSYLNLAEVLFRMVLRLHVAHCGNMRLGYDKEIIKTSLEKIHNECVEEIREERDGEEKSDNKHDKDVSDVQVTESDQTGNEHQTLQTALGPQTFSLEKIMQLFKSHFLSISNSSRGIKFHYDIEQLYKKMLRRVPLDEMDNFLKEILLRF